MSEWRISIEGEARRDPKKLPQVVANRVLDAVERPIPRPGLGDIKKLRGRGAEYRLRVGDHRVIFEVLEDKRVVSVTTVRDRRDAYR